MPTLTADQNTGKLSRDTLEHVRRNRGFQLEIPGPVVHHVRRGLHLAVNRAADRVASEAKAMAEASRNRFATMPPSYTAALTELDDKRAQLGRIGWGGDQHAPENLSIRLIGAPVPDFGIFHEAITLAADDRPEDEPAAARLDELLAAMKACIEDAEEAHKEWSKNRPALKRF